MTALLGVLLGGALTFVAQWLLSRRAERLRSRTERLEACVMFASAAANARSAQYDRWRSTHEQGSVSEQSAAKTVSYTRRAELRVSQFRLRLLQPVGMSNASVDTLVDRIGTLHKSQSRDQLRTRSEAILNDIHAFLDEANRAIATSRPARSCAST